MIASKLKVFAKSSHNKNDNKNAFKVIQVGSWIRSRISFNVFSHAKLLAAPLRHIGPLRMCNKWSCPEQSRFFLILGLVNQKGAYFFWLLTGL